MMMSVWQYDFLAGLGFRERDLPNLPQEVQDEFARLGKPSELRNRDPAFRSHMFHLTSPHRRTRAASRPGRRSF